MSDYLTTLAARSLQAAPIAAPRVASLFEPLGPSATPIGAPPSLEIDAPATLEPRAETTRAIDLAPALDTRTPPPPHAPPVAPPALASRVPHEPLERSRVPPLHASAEPSAPTVHPVAIKAREPVAPDAKPASNTEAAVPPVVILREVRREPATEAHGPPPPLRLDEVVRRLTEDRLADLERRLSPRVERAEPPRPAADVQSPIVRMPENRERPAARAVRLPLDGPATEATPLVSVTIGRIEVRAVTAAAPAAPATPVVGAASGTTPLDEYLKQRSGGGR